MKNIFYIHTHDMGRFNSIYGYNIKTPNMMQIAKDSTVFRNAHCACPTCSPSRGALLTGMMPHSNGLIGLAHRHSVLKRNDAHLAKFLKSKGYFTALFGIQHETYNTEDDIKNNLGYECVNLENPFEENAADFIKQYNSDLPLFMSIGFTDTHREYIKHDETINPDYISVPSCIPDTAETREDFADYVASCEKLDEKIGVIIKALKDKGLYDDSIILFTTDHGIAFPFMKCHLYDYGTGVTMTIKQPFGKEFIPVTDALVSQIDVFPTLCDLVNISKPDYLQGTSLVPVIKGDEKEINDHIFTEISFHAAYEPIRSVRTNKYKYIAHYDKEYTTPILVNIDNGMTKQLLMQNNLKNKNVFSEELYDLMLDPQERNNLANDSSYIEVKNDLSKLINDEIIKTNDPILQGTIKSEKMAVNFRSAENPTGHGPFEVIK